MIDGKKVVITYGTFDLFHKGHYNILKRAKELGDYLIVGVTGESYDVERGKLSVRDSLVKRMENVQQTGFADKIIVEEYLGQKIQHICDYHVDVLVVGSDWKGKFDHMRKYCEVVYLERTKNISSTMLRESDDNKIYKLGIVTEDGRDDDIIFESKHVSGIHPQSVFSPNQEIASRFSSEFELEKWFSDYDGFLETVDIVYVNCDKSEKYKMIKKALENNKIVISSPIVGADSDEIRELYEYAHDNKKVLIECIPTFYLQAYTQLMWNAKGNLIGDVKCVKNSIKLGGLVGVDKEDIEAHLYFSTLFAKKILSEQMKFDVKEAKWTNGVHILHTGNDEEAIYSCELGRSDIVSGDMKIMGTEGSIIVPENWWETGHFELRRYDEENVKRYSCNFNGNGMRYVLVSVLSQIDKNHYTEMRLTKDEIISAAETVKSN